MRKISDNNGDKNSAAGIKPAGAFCCFLELNHNHIRKPTLGPTPLA